MTASKFNFDSDTAIISIIPNQTIRADFNLNPDEPLVVGSYTGTVIDSFSNLFITDVKVEIVGTGLEAYTDDIGWFQINNVLPGTYQVVFSRDLYATKTKDVEIFAGQTTTDSLIQLDRLEL